MKEQFDRAIRNHIRDTFGSFDDQMADDGWKKFNDKKRRKRRGLIFWYTLPSGIAAALALVWLLNWNNLSNINKNNQAQIAKQTIDKNENINKSKENIEILSDKKQDKIVKNNKPEQNSLEFNKTKKDLEPTLKNDNNLENISTHNNLSHLGISKEKEISYNELIIANSTENINHTNPIEVNAKDFKPLATENITLQLNQNLLANQSLKKDFYSLPPQLSEDKKPQTIKKDRFKMSVDANTYYSFSDAGVNDALNLGFGLATELKLTKKLSLNSGILLNRQTSSFDGNSRSTSDFKLASFSTLAAVPEAQITNAKLIGLDIPLDLKFDFKVGKIKSFITSGISSYSVINEEYINDYSIVNYSITGILNSNITDKRENPAGNFSYFKFARTVNFSFGFLYPLTKKSTISVEPFMKYPLSGLGYQDLKIGSGGLSFKLNFGR
ncbi:hypothetical protein A5893_08065 [Pedobacter psychrophilus]|uniref:Outer membrane protein beta-barrel domain-containing protein n=1 Tax=Pedobacter psychrophilus TaxID=1826909 RepID=A0A179DFG0_9SPHI|nr:hypothetical protein [Pedobacter psychrophilus]OAQ39542.1 hypothetical protein A5893_08065 [Pedobacter psychrophilus]